MAEPLTVTTPLGPVTARIVAVAFDPLGGLRSLTLWPEEEVTVRAPFGNAPARMGVSPRMVTAPNWHSSRQAPQRVHTAVSISGISRLAVRARVMHGRRNRCRFGSSTSRSTAATGRFQTSDQTEARDADTVVLPVPPLPLAMATSMLL